jgi:hypothetical protein
MKQSLLKVLSSEKLEMMVESSTNLKRVTVLIFKITVADRILKRVSVRIFKISKGFHRNSKTFNL